MDGLYCCISKIVHLCIESSIFLNQLYKFEYELSKLHSSYHNSSKELFSILDHFTIINKELNIYYKNYYLKIYTDVFTYLLRKNFTLNCSNEIMNDFHEDLTNLNNILNQHKKYYKEIFYYLHKLCIMCSLCIEYRQSCTNLELINRFIYLRIDLLINLKTLNKKIQILLTKINSKFEKRKQYSIKNKTAYYHSKSNSKLLYFLRTIFLWFITILFMGYYFQWSIFYETKSKRIWPM